MNKDYFNYLHIHLEQRTKYALLMNQFSDIPIETLSLLHDIKASKDFTKLRQELHNFNLIKKNAIYWTLSFRSNFCGKDEMVFIEGSLEEIYIKAKVYIKWLNEQTEIIKDLSNFKFGEK